MMIKCILINENGASVIDIENDYRAFNKALNWDDAWNTPSVKINGEQFIIVCSDTGKLRHEPISAISLDNLIAPKSTIVEPFIVGSIIITKYDGTDDFASLSEHDIDTIMERLYKHNKNYPDWFNTLLVLD